MTQTQIINNLWSEFRDAIDTTYRLADLDGYEDRQCLRNYAQNVSMSDDLEKLLDAETANERRHRTNRLQVVGFSAGTAAKLILMQCAINGSNMVELPKSTTFLVLRKTAVEAEVIGFLCGDRLVAPWRNAVKSFDYAKLMAA